MMPKETILLVEDDDDLRKTVKANLEHDGYSVFESADAADLMQKLVEVSADTILLDLGLPDKTGPGLIADIRMRTNAPIIIFSGKADMLDKVVGLEMGADDYVCKPVEMRELSARVRANVRRYRDTANASQNITDPQSKPSLKSLSAATRIQFSNWILDRSRYQIYDLQGNDGGLSTKEFLLLEALILSANRVLSREHLFDHVHDNEDIFDRAIDVQITRIRKKIGDDARAPKMIKTIRGIGYMFCSDTNILE